MQWRPKYRHVYVVYRVDLYDGIFDREHSIEVLKVMPTSESAIAEVERLQSLRRARLGASDTGRTQYFWQQAHQIEQTLQNRVLLPTK